MYLVNLLKYVFFPQSLKVKTKPECGDYFHYYWGTEYEETEKLLAINYKKNKFFTQNTHLCPSTDIRDLYWNKLAERWDVKPWIRRDRENLKQATKGKGWKKC